MRRNVKKRSSGRRVNPNVPPIRLQEWLDYLDVKPAQLADRMKIHRAQVSNWLKDRRPSIDSIQGIADALGIHFLDLFRDPNVVSIDAALRGATSEIIAEVAAIAAARILKHNR